jgi:GST-like protein
MSTDNNNKRDDWVAPASLEEAYTKLSGNRFAGLNSDTAGARTEKELPVGPAEFQLYSLATPNGQKASIACEEFEIEYDAHRIDIMAGDQFTSGFVAVNPNSKIPAMKHGDVRIFESGAILLYLAEKYQKFIPASGSKRAECYSWLMFQMSGQGPMSGQFGHFFRYAPRSNHEAIDYGVARYGMEVRRLLSVMDLHLNNKTWFLGDEYSIADMALYPWVTTLGEKGYNAAEFLDRDNRYPNVMAWCKRMEARPAVQRGMLVCGGPGAAEKLKLLNAQLSKVKL